MIRTVVFVMGNVQVRFTHERMCKQMGSLCGRSGPEIKTLLLDSGLQWDFERGRCDEGEFHRRFEEAVHRRVPIDELRHAASDIFQPNGGMWEIVSGLKKAGYRLVLLSNTSIAHYEFIRERWELLNPFDELVLSYKVGAIKPEPEIFEVALRAIQCPPNEAFYTDDIAAYVEIGRQHGLDAELFTDASTLRRHLSARGVTIDA